MCGDSEPFPQKVTLHTGAIQGCNISQKDEINTCLFLKELLNTYHSAKIE